MKGKTMDNTKSCRECVHDNPDDYEKYSHCCITNNKTNWEGEAMSETENGMDENPDEDWYQNICYECGGYGDDYYIDDQGELVSACDDCRFNGINYDE
jgi:hypothetical protein